MLNHLAIIMDGNRRWAKSRNMAIFFGHSEGAKSIETVLKGAEKYSIKYVTLYAFSSENWQRSKEEIEYLQKLLNDYIEKELNNLNSRGVKICFIGDLSGFADKTKELILKSEETTKNNTKLNLIIALGYGGKNDIVQASVQMARDYKSGKIELSGNANNDAEVFQSYLQPSFAPFPDMVVRTGGECRISNFLLYQIAYSELYFMDILWPDFKESDFDNIVLEFQKRERRYGRD